MQAVKLKLHFGLACLLWAASSLVSAKLPPLTPEQEQVAAAKKAQAQAQQEKEKQELAAAMERVSARWRARASENSWQISSPVPVAAPAAQTGAASQSAADTSSASSPAEKMPIRSEKLGTAPPSGDVKKPAEKGK